jgi:casein kinase I homolog HRR25
LLITQISHIEHIHSHHIVQGDIKPANFLIGAGDNDHKLYLIDFGLARKYRDPKTHLHIPYKANCTPTGTAPYISINNHLGVEQSHRDDVESLAYVFIYLLCGSLPWHSVGPAINKQQWNRNHSTTLQWKTNSPPDLLCSACPPKFSVVLCYTRNLHFDEKPDYNYMCNLFRKLLVHKGHQQGHPFSQYIIIDKDDQGVRMRAMASR